MYYIADLIKDETTSQHPQAGLFLLAQLVETDYDQEVGFVIYLSTRIIS